MLASGTLDVTFGNMGGDITEISKDAYCYFVDDANAKSHLFSSCAVSALTMSVAVKAGTWAEDKAFNLKVCNMKFPAGKPTVTVNYKIGAEVVLTSGAVDYSKDLPAAATALTLTQKSGPVNVGFDYAYTWTLSTLGKIFTMDSVVAATFLRYYDAELGASLRCMVGATADALVDTYCNVEKGSDFRLEVFGSGLGADTTIAADADVIVLVLGLMAPVYATGLSKTVYVEFYE
ncbi:MAG: hypothetical protein QF535_05535 [Anaerolineales bacterium]|jgi:hypothetical protein|nr:hypothetical protein [Anaerolineales bacterium]